MVGSMINSDRMPKYGTYGGAGLQKIDMGSMASAKMPEYSGFGRPYIAPSMATGGNAKMPKYGNYGGAGLQLVDAGRMLPANPFIKVPALADPCYRDSNQMRTMNYTPMDRYCAEKSRAENERNRPFMPRTLEPNNTAVRPFIGHPKFGFQTQLPYVNAPLPTAPAIVGGNTDWTNLKTSPGSMFLHSKLSAVRPIQTMGGLSQMPNALGSVMKLSEPSQNSISTL
jgi:hypothetical protein